MKIPQEIQSFDPDEFDFDDKEQVKTLFLKLLNVIELQAKETERLKKENQQLKDEIQRLKGEKGKSNIKPSVPGSISPPGFRKKTRKWKKKRKKVHVNIDRVVKLSVNQQILPEDAVFKGYRTVTVQNIKFETDNVEYHLERFYSPGEKKTYEAKLPQEVDGEFGPDLKAYVIHQYFANRVPENKIHKTLTEAGVLISAGQISHIITQAHADEFTQEKDDIFTRVWNHRIISILMILVPGITVSIIMYK